MNTKEDSGNNWNVKFILSFFAITILGFHLIGIPSYNISEKKSEKKVKDFLYSVLKLDFFEKGASYILKERKDAPLQDKDDLENRSLYYPDFMVAYNNGSRLEKEYGKLKSLVRYPEFLAKAFKQDLPIKEVSIRNMIGSMLRSYRTTTGKVLVYKIEKAELRFVFDYNGALQNVEYLL